MHERAFGLGGLVLWPAVITLVISVVRLAGELSQWSPLYFSRAEGGGAALIGIVWLVPIFGIYFAWKLATVNRGGAPGRVLGMAGLGLLVLVAGVVLVQLLTSNMVVSIVVFGVLAIVAIVVVRSGSAELFSLLLAYAFAARIPLVVIYFLAFALGWDTHYSAVPADFPLSNWFAQWLVLGVLPQLTFWVAFTVVIGSLFGGLTLLVVGKKNRTA